MSRARGSSTPKTPKNNGNGSKEAKEFHFFVEDGKKYRPFIDPKRIAANDEKKSSKHDARAHVKGVPNKYLGVMPMKAEEVTSNTDTLDLAASEGESCAQAASIESSPNMDGLYQTVFSANTDQFFGNIPSDHPVTDGTSTLVGTQHHHLHLQMPETVAFLSSQDQLQAGSDNSPALPCRSAGPETPLSANQYTATNLTFPCIPSNQIDIEYDSETRFPAFEQGFTSLYCGPEVEYGFSAGTPESMDSSDSSTSILSNASPYTPISDHQHEEYITMGSPVAQRFDDNILVPQQSFPEHQSLDTIIKELSIPIPSYATGDDFDVFVEEISKVMQLKDEDLRYLNAVIMRSYLSPQADLDTFMAPCNKDDPMSDFVLDGA